MTEPTIPPIHLRSVHTMAVFDAVRPRPQFLLDSERLQGLVAGLEPGQQIPSHPEAVAVYYIISGEGVMSVNNVEFPVMAGDAVVAPGGAARGMRAASRLVFLAVKAGA